MKLSLLIDKFETQQPLWTINYYFFSFEILLMLSLEDTLWEMSTENITKRRGKHIKRIMILLLKYKNI